MPTEFSSNAERQYGKRAAIALFVLVATSASVRLILGLTFRARTSWDTGSYVHAAQAIGSLDFRHYDALRTPVYPVLLLLAGMDWNVVRWIQALLGIGIASIMFTVTWHRTRSAALSFVVGLLSGLAISELLYEQIIYSETLCTFWIVLSIFAFARAKAGENDTLLEYALLGASAALAGMTRPMFLYLGPLYFCFMIVRARRLELRIPGDARLALVLAPTLLLTIGWSAVNKHTVNYFGVTTTTGFNLTNHSGAFMELAPPRYSEIADIYLKYRGRQIQRMGSQTMTIWLAVDEIKRKTGLSTAGLSKQLTLMSLEMFAEHPLLYLKSVARSWVRFWGIGLYYDVGFFESAAGNGMLYTLLLVCGTLQLGINIAFLLITAYSIAQLVRGRANLDFELCVIAIVLAASVVQAFLEYGENIRYLAPLVPLTIYTVVTFIWRQVELLIDGPEP